MTPDENISQDFDVRKYTSLKYDLQLTILVEINSDSKNATVKFYDGLKVPRK